MYFPTSCSSSSYSFFSSSCSSPSLPLLVLLLFFQLANVMREGNGQVWWNQKDGYSVVRLHNSDPNYRRYKVLVDLDQREVEVDAEDLELVRTYFGYFL